MKLFEFGTAIACKFEKESGEWEGCYALHEVAAGTGAEYWQ